MSETNQNAKTILEAGAALAKVQVPDDTGPGMAKPFVVLPAGYAVHDLEKLLPQPMRKTATVAMLDVPSFIGYVNKHKAGDETVIYADVDYETGQYTMVAVIDDHGAGEPMWRGHRSTLTPIQSVEWKRWKENNKKSMPQADFAAFIEDNLGDITGADKMPSGKDMLQMALAFEATSEKRFKKKIDLQGGGTHLEYIDQADEATSTKLKLFERFTIGIPVFQGATEGYAIEARLKFRAVNGMLSFWYELVRPDRVFKTAVSGEIDKIREATGLLVLFGRP